MIHRFASIIIVGTWVCGCGIGVLAVSSAHLPAQSIDVTTANESDSESNSSTSFTLDQPLIIQRVRIPSDKILDFVSTKRLRPVPMAEFTATIRAIQDLTNGPPALRIAQAEYEARWQSGALVDGKAALDIELEGEGRQGLRLSPMSWALQSIWWSGNPKVTAEIVATEEEPALVMVDRSGRLEFMWSLAANESTDGLDFILNLPRCPRCRMQLELPSAMEPEVAGATVRRMSQDQASSPIARLDSLPTPAANRPETSRWEIIFAGETQARLRLRETSGPTRQGLTTTWMSDTRYQITPSGIEVTGKFRVSPVNLTTHELDLWADPELRIDSVRIQDNPVTFSSVPLPAGRTLIRVPLPTANSGLTTIEWHGLSVLPAKKFTLPTISVKNAWWLASTSTIDIDDELFLVDFDAENCKASEYEVGQPGSSLFVNHSLDDARIQIACESPRDRHRSRIAHSATLEESNIACVSRMAVEVEGTAPLRSLELDLAADWQIDAITSNAISLPWEMRELRPGVRKLLVLLPTPVTPGASLLLEIHTSRTNSQQLDESMALAAVQPIVDAEAASSEVIISLSAPAEFRVRISNQSGIEWVDVNLPSFVDEWKKLLPGYATRRNFKLTQTSANARFFLDRELPRYRSEIEIHVIATQTQTRREVRIRCIPEGSAITQLPIQWNSSDIGTWEWSLHDHTADAISIRVDAVNERSDAEIDQRTHWISFSEAMSREFTLVATSIVDSKLNKNVPLVAVPQATDQQATVQLSMDHAWRWNSLVPLVQLPFQPQDVRGSDGVPAMRARFRYDPSAIANSPVVELLPAHTSVPQLPTAWIWQQHIVNRVAQNGSTEHWTTYYVENFGSDHLQIRLPAGTQIRDLYRDGQHIAAMPNRTPRGNVLLPLIPHQKYSVFTVCHHSFRRPLENQEEIRFDRTTCTTPIHSTRESTVVPPGYLGSSPPPRSIVSTTLQQRLCGPFSPLISYETPSWSLWSVDFSGRIAQQEVLARIEKVLETLGKSVIESPAEFNWRNLLLVTALAVPEIRVDPSALRRNNLQPESLIPVQNSQQLSTREIGLTLLQKASLVAVGTPLGVCLTDRTRTDQIRGYDKSQSDGSVVVVDDGGSTQSLWQLFNECEEVSDWSTRQWPFVASPVHSPDVQLSDARERGWTVVESLDCGEAPLSVTIQRSDSFYAVGWTSLLIAFAVYFRLRHLGRGFVLASGCLSVAFALFVPFPYYPLASGIWIGWCCARLATYTFRSIELRSVRWGAVTFIGTAVWITQIAAPAMSAEPSPPIIDRQHNLDERTSTSEIGRVLIPYDDNEPQKEGPYVYMSSELYRGLAEKLRKLKSLPGAWWIAAANYELVAETHQGQTTVTKAVARIDVGTVAPGTEIALPFRRKEVRSIDVQWDSTPTLMQARWRSDGEAILVVCPTGGTIPLRIEFSLEKPELNAENGISFQVPQVAVSQVALQVATSQANTTCPLQITSAVGVTRWDSANQTLFATLGDSRLLSIDVARLPQDQSDSAAGTMDQRISAVFAPGGIRLEIVGTWKLSKNGLRTIPWNIDPRWQLAESPRSESVQWIARRISTQRLLCEATHPLPDRGSIHLSFLVPVDRATPIFSLATAESPALPTRNRLLDWQVEGLVSTPQPLTNGVQLSKVGGDLVAASPSANSDIGKTPVYSIPDRESRWLLTWDANDRRLEGEREIIYSLESDRITARLAAEIDATSQAPLFHRIDIPSGWTVKRVDIRQLGKRVPIQWSQSSSSNHVAVWSEHPLDGHYRVTCVAEQLITDQGQMALPSLGVQGVVWRESVWKVAPPGRDVRWELDQADSIRVAESELSTGSNNDSWRDEAPRVLRWYPHTPQGNNQVATYLEHRGGAWHATVVGQRTVSNGRYDEIRLEIPADWQDRLVMDSFDYDFQVAAVPHRVTLVIRPAVPVTNSLQYRFTCTLSATNGPDTVAPIIESPDVEQDEQFLVVPRTVADQAWAWQADGLSRVEQLPDSVRRPESLLEQVIYRAANNRFRLAGRPEGRTLESPDIPLCDAIVRLLPDGTFAGTVNFDVASPLTGACVVMAPPGVSIQQILVDAHLPQAHRTSTSQWQVDFGNTEFPQRISVAFHGTSVRDPSSSPGHDEVLKLPVLQNLAGSTWPAQSTLWTIVIPPRVTQRDVHYILRGMSTCNELAQRLVRLQNAQRLISAVHQQFGNNRESQRWTTGWSARWNRLMSLPTDDTATDEQKIAFDSFVAWDRTNSLASSPGDTLSAEGSEFEIGGQTGANNSSVETVVRCSQTGWQPELTLQPVGLSTQSLAFLATCSTFSTAFLMAVLLYCSATARYWCARSKTLLTLAAGVASYLWLAPTAISYVIIAVAIATGWNRLRVYLVR